MNIISFTKELMKSGLNEKEASVYEVLLKKGEAKVIDLSEATAFKRGDLYNILSSLKEKNLAEEVGQQKVAIFRPKDPNGLKDQIDLQRTIVEENNASLKSVLPSLVSIFNLNQQKPSVRVYEGVGGLSRVYDELNSSGKKELLLYRSIDDENSPGLGELIAKQIKSQVRRGICVKALTPNVAETKEWFLNFDKVNLVERRILPVEDFSLPAQFIVWGDTVAIISMKKEIISTVIENRDIAQSFKVIFAYIWKISLPWHNDLTAPWQKESRSTYSNQDTIS